MSFKRFASLAIVLFLVSGGVSACKKAPKEEEAPPVPPSPPPPTTQTYSSTEYAFHFTVPVEWEKKENEGGAVVVFLSPLLPDDTFQESFSVSVDDKSKPKTLDAYLKKAVAETRKGKTDFKEGESTAATVGGVEGKVWTYEYKEGDKNLKVVQWVVLKDDKVYILKGTALADTFDAFKEQFDKIVSSFMFGAAMDVGAAPTAEGAETGSPTEGTGSSGS